MFDDDEREASEWEDDRPRSETEPDKPWAVDPEAQGLNLPSADDEGENSEGFDYDDFVRRELGEAPLPKDNPLDFRKGIFGMSWPQVGMAAVALILLIAFALSQV